MRALIERCLSARERDDLTLADLRDVLKGDIDAAELDAVLVHDDRRPYGRRVLLDGPQLEMMVASWTRDTMCVPHDHGGSIGAVRVLRGEALHRMWRLVDGRLELAAEERVGAGHVLACGPDLIHSMGDAGAAERLATLHLYTGPIPFMVVYDTAGDRTLQVAANCGAWIPGPEQIVRELPGINRRVSIA